MPAPGSVYPGLACEPSVSAGLRSNEGFAVVLAPVRFGPAPRANLVSLYALTVVGA